MSAECKIFGVCRIGLLAALLMGGAVFAQTGNTPAQPSGLSTALQTFQQGRLELAQQWRALISRGATEQQLEAWEQQNAQQLEALQQLGQQLSLASALEPIPIRAGANLPSDITGTLKHFLKAQLDLANARAQIHNQLLQAMPANPSQEQISAMKQEETQAFQQQNAAGLQLQQQRVQALAAASSSQPLRVPGPAVIPPNATPQLQAYLIARNALASDRAQLWNQYLTADPAARQAAMLQWLQENSARIEQLHQLAQNLTNATSNPQEQNQ